MTVDDLLFYYVDDYIEIYSIEEQEIVFKGMKETENYDEFAYYEVSSFEFENDYIVINI